MPHFIVEYTSNLEGSSDIDGAKPATLAAGCTIVAICAAEA